MRPKICLKRVRVKWLGQLDDEVPGMPDQASVESSRCRCLRTLDFWRSLLRAAWVLRTEFWRVVTSQTVRMWSPTPGFSQNVSPESRFRRLNLPRAPGRGEGG